MKEWRKIIIDNKETYYSVSNDGEVRNDSTKTLLKGSVSKNGYRMVHLRQHMNKICSVHRLVMKAFQPCELMDELQINHKDGDKLNNNIDNLEWCTALENIRHSYETGLQKYKMLPCHVYDLDGNYITSYANALEAAKDIPVNQSSINQCLKGEWAHCKQWQFKTFKKSKIDPWTFNNGKGKKVFVYDVGGDFVTVYDTQIEAARALGVNKKTIPAHIKNGRPIANFILSSTPM